MHDHTKQQLDELVEKLADIEHQRWSRWQKYLHSQCYPDELGNLIIPIGRVRHWERQINTDYKDLTEREKGKDKEQVYEYLPLIQQALKSQAEYIKAEMHTHPGMEKKMGIDEYHCIVDIEAVEKLDELINSFE